MTGRRLLFLKVLPAILAVSSAADAWTEPLFNGKMTPSEGERINRGEVVIRNIEKAANISINGDIHPNVKQAVEAIQRLDPTYLAEVIQVRPYDRALIRKTQAILQDVPSYRGIPYYSERNERYFDLYSLAEVRSREKRGGDGWESDVLHSYLVMQPFTPLEVDITINRTGESLFYRMENTNRIRVDDFQFLTVAKEGNMQSIIVVFPYEDKLVFYGIGGVNGPTVFFLKERIQVSFINRIKTFCMYVYEKL